MRADTAADTEGHPAPGITPTPTPDGAQSPSTAYEWSHSAFTFCLAAWAQVHEQGSHLCRQAPAGHQVLTAPGVYAVGGPCCDTAVHSSIDGACVRLGLLLTGARGWDFQGHFPGEAATTA